MSHRKPTSDTDAHERYCLVAGFDFSEGSSTALDHALTLAASLPLAAVHVVWVLPREPARARALERSRELASASDCLHGHVAFRASALSNPRRQPDSGNCEVSANVLMGSPARAINDLALRLGAHLIVVGSHGRAGLERVVLGHVAADVLAGAPCPVLIARGRAIEQLPHGSSLTGERAPISPTRLPGVDGPRTAGEPDRTF